MKTHIYFLLDRTGSMASMAADVIGGFNEFLAEQRADGADARITLVQFDSQDPFEVLVDAGGIASVRDLSPRTFRPRGNTPLFDATGNLIAHAANRVAARTRDSKKPESILVVTFTDGEENASRRFGRKQILELVRAKEAEGWTFVFLGAGLDAYAEGGQIGYATARTQAFAPDGQGAREAFSSLSRATSGHRGRARRSEDVHATDFFEDKAAEEDRARRGGSAS